MLNRTTTLILLLSFLFVGVYAQSFKQQYVGFLSKKDTASLRLLLTEWAKTDSNNPELFIAYFNYYVLKSKQEIIILGQNPKGNDVLQVMDKDSSKKEPLAYLYGNKRYDPEYLNQGFDWIDKGIKLFPNRLDMRFGKTYMLGEIEDYENFTQEIIKAVNYSSVNQNNWVWKDDKPLDKPKEFLLSNIQTYQIQLYNTNNDDLLLNMKRIAEAVLNLYPDHIESLSNLSIVYMLQKNYDEALTVLLKAEKLNTKDHIVLNNIAHAYKQKGDKKNAVKYYELSMKYGDDEQKVFAQKQIADLKKKK